MSTMPKGQYQGLRFNRSAGIKVHEKQQRSQIGALAKAKSYCQFITRS